MAATDQDPAEQALHTVQRQPGFARTILQLIAALHVDENVRFAGVLLFKNYVKTRWAQTDGEDAILPEDKAAVKSVIVDLMIAAPQRIQRQLSEALSIIADNDFPGQWESLIAQFVSKLSLVDFRINNGVLQTAHSIFKRWCNKIRSNALYEEINFVSSQFCQPYMQLFVSTDALISANSDNKDQLLLYCDTMLLLVKIFYSFNYQDIPEFFEDHQDVFFPLMLKYLAFTNPVIETADDEEAGVLEKIKTCICEIAIMYTGKYALEWKHLGQYIEATWMLLTTTGQQPKHDMLVSRAITLLTGIVREPDHKANFEAPQTLKQIVEMIVLPNMRLRESDEELFEDDPIEFIRRDMEGLDSDTRRRSASDLVKGLLGQFEAQVTEICYGYVNQFLQNFAQDKSQWKDKDAALALFIAVASKSQSTAHGISTINTFLNVVEFFSNSVFPDMQSISSDVHPILTVDAIKFLYTFRNQLTTEQLLSVFPLLVQQLTNSNYVVYTYAAVSIDKVLSMKLNNIALITPSNLNPFAGPILITIFDILRRQNTPEKLSENDYLMRTVMRVISSAGQEIVPIVSQAIMTLNRLVEITSRNPSNPKFTHYVFESICALIKNLCDPNPTSVGEFESFLMPTFDQVLSSDVQEFIPYVFQIIAQMLEYHSSGALPISYTTMLPSLLQPAIWETQGNIAALVRLLQSYLSRNAQQMVIENQIPAILGIFQKLVSSKTNDTFGFELLQATLFFTDRTAWRGFMPKVITLMLSRLQNGKTNKFAQAFLQFICFYACLEPSRESPQEIVDIIESLQAGVFSGVTKAVLIPAFQTVGGKQDRQRVIFGFSKILANTNYFLQAGNHVVCAELLSNLLAFVDDVAANLDPFAVTETDDIVANTMDEVRYQNAYSKLTGVPVVTTIAAPSVKAARSYFVETVQQLMQREPGTFQAICQQATAREFGPLLERVVLKAVSA